MKKILYWAPRVLSIMFILFLGIFALDVFAPGSPIVNMIVGLIIHLIPNFILLTVLFIAWKNEFIGGIGFLFLYVVAVFFFRAEIVGFVLFSPLILIGALFLFSSYLAKRKNGAVMKS